MRATLLVIGMLIYVALVPAAPAEAAVGVEKVSRPAGAPGDAVKLTLGCGFCYPPCKGPEGRPDGPCMPGNEAPPESFPVSLVPIEKAPEPYPCGPNALCSPHTRGAPRKPPFTYLGRATPPSDDEVQTDRPNVPRYLLDFAIPDLRPGVYTYVVFCDVCLPGKAGSLIANPRARPWRLRVRLPASQ